MANRKLQEGRDDPHPLDQDMEKAWKEMEKAAADLEHASPGETCDGNDGPPFWFSAAILRFSAAILRHCGCCSQCWC